MFDLTCCRPAFLNRVVARDLLVVLTMALFLPANFSIADDPGQTKTAKRIATQDVETALLTFDELVTFQQFPPVQHRRFPVEVYRAKHGLMMGTCDLVGMPVVGKTVRLTNPLASFEVICGKDQPFISPHCILTAAGRGTRDLLLTFETPVTSVSIVSDKFPETPDVIRMLIVEPIETDNERPALEKNASRQVDVRVLAIDEKQDDSNTAPGNTLSVDLKGKPFHHVLIECTTETEAFDDLRFTRTKDSSADKTDRVSPLFDWTRYATNASSSQQNRSFDFKSREKGTGR